MPEQPPSIAGGVDSSAGLSVFESPGASTGYSADFFRSLVPQFEEVVYSLNPIITPGEILEAIANMGHSFEDAALVYAFGSATTFLTQEANTMPGGVSTQMDEMIQFSLEAHKRADLRVGPNGRLIEEPLVNLKRIMTCIYLEISTMAFKRFDRSFALLREAITMLQTLAANHFLPEGVEAAKYQRLYWGAYVHERFLTIASGYPSIMPPLSSGLPAHDPSLKPHVELGWNRIISLFLVMDRRFLVYWTEEKASDDSIPEITIQWIESKQAQLDDDEVSATQANHELQISGCGALTELQVADLFVSRLWMRTILWQLALSRGLLRSGPLPQSHEGLSLHFPAQRLSTQLRTLVDRLESVASISTQGSGILQKLFEIISTIADVLALPLGHDQAGLDLSTQMEDFVCIVKFLFHFERIWEHQKQYLREKLELLQQQYPAIVGRVF